MKASLKYHPSIRPGGLVRFARTTPTNVVVCVRMANIHKITHSSNRKKKTPSSCDYCERCLSKHSLPLTTEATKTAISLGTCGRCGICGRCGHGHTPRMQRGALQLGDPCGGMRSWRSHDSPSQKTLARWFIDSTMSCSTLAFDSLGQRKVHPTITAAATFMKCGACQASAIRSLRPVVSGSIDEPGPA